MATFNPFEKEIHELEFLDLERLKERNISEGVYVEYKSDFPSPRKIAHSIASFANMYGGWYFIGIETDESNVPCDFPGFDLSEHPKPKETIRDIALSHVNPFPLFDSQLIKVDDGKAILAILIQESLEPPHITKDGKIYRRNGEGGDPVAENDRYAIDRLYDKSKRFNEIVENFCQNEIVTSEAQSRQGWLEIYSMTYPIGKLIINNFSMEEYIDSIKTFLDNLSPIPSLKEFGDVTANVPFNNVATSVNSIIFRQPTPDTLKDLTLTFEFFIDGNAKVIIPFQYVDLYTPPMYYKKSENLITLRESLHEERVFFRVIDGFALFWTALIILTKYHELLEREEWNDKLIIKYRLNDCWRSIIFFDSDAFTKHAEKYGIPVSQKDVIVIPDKLSGDNWSIVSFDDIIELSALAHFVDIAMSMGFHFATFVNIIIKDLFQHTKRVQELNRESQSTV